MPVCYIRVAEVLRFSGIVRFPNWPRMPLAAALGRGVALRLGRICDYLGQEAQAEEADTRCCSNSASPACALPTSAAV